MKKKPQALITNMNHKNSISPVVSVGIPTLNRPDGLNKTLNDIKKQSYKNLEIIVSDNASDDVRVMEIINEHALSDIRVKPFRQDKNIGAAANFEFVLNQAKGDYFLWVADDDICDPRFIEVLIDQLQNDACIALAMCDVGVIDEHDNLMRVEKLEKIRYNRAIWKDCRRIFFGFPIENLYLCIYGIYRTEALKSCRISFSSWKNYIYSAELPILAQIATRGRIISVEGVFKMYRSYPDSSFLREYIGMSRFDRFAREIQIRFQTFLIIWSDQLPLKDRMELSGYSLMNFCRMILLSVISLPSRVYRKIKSFLG